ncbi:MBL fold metallo-hydrolase [Oceanidesulfovibrio indonesiensis]|nr:MBL fold metallo-hydrolase [Oceanidesulfovibrio indonesiensis]
MSMFVETVKSEGLAHLSYIVGHGGQAVVIDPRRDCEVYLDIAEKHGAAIQYVFETHRNEDYVIGSQELSRLTGASIHHGAATEFAYGNAVKEGDVFRVGALEFKVLETPGHTYDSISLVMRDTNAGDSPLAVFTGDALFIGDVGRTDFFPDRKEEVAGLLYDSIFEKLLPLGDQAILYPAHGAGSVCGKGMAPRDFSTIGHERKHNPLLQLGSREAFIERKVAERHPLPPYFRRMEVYNQEGTAPSVLPLPRPTPLSASAFAERMDQGLQVVDLRSPEAFAGAFIPGSIAIPLNMLAAYAGFILSYDTSIGLVAETHEQVDTAVRRLLRIGYDSIPCFLEGGLGAWEKSGREYDTIPAVHADELVRRIEEKDDFVLVDVRSEEEWESGHLPDAVHAFLGDLPDNLDVDKSRLVTTFCGSGERAIIAASILKQNGWSKVEDALGSMMACMERGCPLVEE